MLGKLVRELRGLNISQRELAQNIGVSHSYISKLESSIDSNVTDEIIEKLALALECDKSVMYIACGKIPPDQLNINIDAPSLYAEIEQYIRSSSPKIHSALDEYSILFNAYNESKTILFLINGDDRKLVYMNISAVLFLRKLFPDQDTNQVLSHYMDKIINHYEIEGNAAFVYECELRGCQALIDVSMDSMDYNNQRYFLIQISEERSKDRFNEYSLFSEKHFRGVFDNALNAVFIFQYPLDDQYGALMHINQAAIDLLGYTREEFMSFIGPFDFELQSNTSKLRLRKLLLIAHDHDVSVFKTKDGRFIPVEIFSHVGTMGKNRFILMSCTDLNLLNKGHDNP